MRIGIVAPACPIAPELAERVTVIAGARAELVFHAQCFLSEGHFAGPDVVRTGAFVEMANDPSLDAIWFARGGYGSCRIVEQALPRLGEAARAKTYLGYSDMGTLLGALYQAGIGRVAHGPMPADLNRAGGEAAVRRALDWLVDGTSSALEPGLDERPAAAFNIMILAALAGTPWMPDLAGHVLLLEEIGEYHYRIDRAMFSIASHPSVRRAAGIRLGRVSDITENDRPFGWNEEEIVRHWCGEAGIAYLGRADIGHDAGNRIVPFGSPRRV